MWQPARELEEGTDNPQASEQQEHSAHVVWANGKVMAGALRPGIWEERHQPPISVGGMKEKGEEGNDCLCCKHHAARVPRNQEGKFYVAFP